MNVVVVLQSLVRNFMKKRHYAKIERIRDRSWRETYQQLEQGTVTVKQVRDLHKPTAIEPKSMGALCAAARYEAKVDQNSWAHL